MAELFNLLASRTHLENFLQYLIAFCNWPEAASDVISGTFVPDKHVQFCDHRLNRTEEISTEAIRGGIFYGFSWKLLAVE